MPRGVYPRKKKGEEAPKATPSKKSAPSKKAAPAKTAKAPVTAKEVQPSQPAVSAEPGIGVNDAFNVLGANLTTLTEAYTRLDSNADLRTKVGNEISATVDAISALRQSVFGSLVPPAAAPQAQPETAAPVEATEEEEQEPEVEAAPTLPTPPAPVKPVLPNQPGNAQGFHPPAPPVQQG